MLRGLVRSLLCSMLCKLWVVGYHTNQPVTQSAASDWRWQHHHHCISVSGDLHRPGGTRDEAHWHAAQLACSCLSGDQLCRVRGNCVGGSRPSFGIRMPLVALCGLLCGMNTSYDVADQGPTTY